MPNQTPEFDQYATHYRAIVDNSLAATGESSDFFARYKAGKLATWFPHFTNQPCSILDFGCGDGLMTTHVAHLFKQALVVGIDPSPESIAVAQQQPNQNISFVVAGTSLNFPGQQFDLIYAAGVFHHIEFAQHTHYLNEIFRILKPGGSFILFELNPLNHGTRYIFKRNPIDQNAHMLTPWYAQKLVKAYGISRTKFYGFFPRALRWLRWTEPFLTKLPIGGLYACIVKKQKSCC
jgi:ubiquinone/menaquinone biosynthesis C-methylase UbiE